MTAHFVEKRRPPFWLAALALSCATSKSSESQLQLSGKEETQTTAVEHREFTSTEHEGPWRVTRYIYGTQKAGAGASLPRLPVPALHKPGSGAGASDQDAEGVSGAGGPTEIIVEDHFGRDITRQASSDGLSGAETRADVKANWRDKETSMTRWGPPWWAYALIAGVLAALAAAAFFKPPLLLKLLARIFP